MSCFYEFSEKEVENCSCGINRTSLEDMLISIKSMVLDHYSLDTLTCEILNDLQLMFSGFVYKDGYHIFNLHFGKVFTFYSMLHNLSICDTNIYKLSLFLHSYQEIFYRYHLFVG